jgi:hypothetical protein
MMRLVFDYTFYWRVNRVSKVVVDFDQKCDVAFPFAAILPTNTTPRVCGNTGWLDKILLEPLAGFSFMRSPKLRELVLDD